VPKDNLNILTWAINTKSRGITSNRSWDFANLYLITLFNHYVHIIYVYPIYQHLHCSYMLNVSASNCFLTTRLFQIIYSLCHNFILTIGINSLNSADVPLSIKQHTNMKPLNLCSSLSINIYKLTCKASSQLEIVWNQPNRCRSSVLAGSVSKRSIFSLDWSCTYCYCLGTYHNALQNSHRHV